MPSLSQQIKQSPCARCFVSFLGSIETFHRQKPEECMLSTFEVSSGDPLDPDVQMNNGRPALCFKSRSFGTRPHSNSVLRFEVEGI